MSSVSPESLRSVVQRLRLGWQNAIQNGPVADASADQHLMRGRGASRRDGELSAWLLDAIHALRAASLPLDRLSLALVPDESGFNGVQYQWSIEEPHGVHSFLRLPSFFQGPDHRTSVLHHICCTGRPERLRLQEMAADAIPFPLLQGLRRDHFHDYLALPLPEGETHRVVLTLASRDPAGFSGQQLLRLQPLLPTMRQLLQATDHFGLGRWEPLDPLTGLWSRHQLERHISQLLGTEDGSRTPALALLLLDLREFSGYMAEFGHLIADEALVAVADQLQARWSGDVGGMARIGCDSFALLLEGAEPAEALPLLERAGRSVSELRLAHPAGREPFLGCHLALLSLQPAWDGTRPLARHLLVQGDLLLAEARRLQCTQRLELANPALGSLEGAATTEALRPLP